MCIVKQCIQTRAAITNDEGTILQFDLRKNSNSETIRRKCPKLVSVLNCITSQYVGNKRSNFKYVICTKMQRTICTALREELLLNVTHLYGIVLGTVYEKKSETVLSDCITLQYLCWIFYGCLINHCFGDLICLRHQDQ